MGDLKRFEDLKGNVIVGIENIDNVELVFVLENGDTYKLYHSKDCCESVEINDINGDLNDLLFTPILLAEEVTSEEPLSGVEVDYDDSFTWTFYKLSTIKGSVTIRWLGESNGYYSESVDWKKVK